MADMTTTTTTSNNNNDDYNDTDLSLSTNTNGGVYKRGKTYSKQKRAEVAQIYIELKKKLQQQHQNKKNNNSNDVPTKNNNKEKVAAVEVSIRRLATEAKVSRKFAGMIKQQVDGDGLAPPKKRKKFGVGSQCLSEDDKRFILSLRNQHKVSCSSSSSSSTSDNHTPRPYSLQNIADLLSRHRGTSVSKTLIHHWLKFHDENCAAGGEGGEDGGDSKVSADYVESCITENDQSQCVGNTSSSSSSAVVTSREKKRKRPEKLAAMNAEEKEDDMGNNDYLQPHSVDMENENPAVVYEEEEKAQSTKGIEFEHYHKQKKKNQRIEMARDSRETEIMPEKTSSTQEELAAESNHGTRKNEVAQDMTLLFSSCSKSIHDPEKRITNENNDKQTPTTTFTENNEDTVEKKFNIDQTNNDTLSSSSSTDPKSNKIISQLYEEEKLSSEALLHSQIILLQTELQQCKTQLATQSDQLEKQNEEFEEQIRTINYEANNRILRSEQHVQRIEAQFLNSTKNVVDVAETSNSEKDALIAQLQKENKALKKKRGLLEQEVHFSNQEVFDLREKLESLEQKYEDACVRIKTLGDALLSMKGQVSAAKIILNARQIGP